MKKNLLVLTCAVVFCSAAMADQAAWIEKKDAEAARRILQTQRVIKHFCEPCRDTKVITENVSSVDVRDTGYDAFQEVFVNGKGIDLAYIYVWDGKAWVNLAMKLSIEVGSVSRVLKQ
ncbi:MAG: hypothetical protein LBU53_11750 [Zoogloeaceae bacterium]|jgi:hypothetical protein|nr:hypothetical protein [Zoogloeaceae bacterium]